MAMKRLNGYDVIDTSAGQANGIATLTAERKVPASQLPTPLGETLFTAKDYEEYVESWANKLKNGAYKPTLWQELDLSSVFAIVRISLDQWFIVRSTGCTVYSMSTTQETEVQVPNFRSAKSFFTCGNIWYLLGYRRSDAHYCLWYSLDHGSTWIEYGEWEVGVDSTNSVVLCTDDYTCIYGATTYLDVRPRLIQGAEVTSLLIYDPQSFCFGDNFTEYFGVSRTSEQGQSADHLYYYDGTTISDISPSTSCVTVAYYKGILTLRSTTRTFVSRDKGATWQIVSSVAAYSTRRVSFFLALPQIAYWGHKTNYADWRLFASVDGEVWQVVLILPSDTSPLLGGGLIQQNGLVFLCTNSQLYLLEGFNAVLLREWQLPNSYSYMSSTLCYSENTYSFGSSTIPTYCKPEPLYLS